MKALKLLKISLLSLRVFNMPFKSKAQARYLFAKEPEVAEEFATKTKSIKKLPEHVKKTKEGSKKSLAAKIKAYDSGKRKKK